MVVLMVRSESKHRNSRSSAHDGGDFGPRKFGSTEMLFRLGDFGDRCDTQDLLSSSL